MSDAAGARKIPTVVYVSYDGALDPLGWSQVVSYLVGLAASSRLVLVSFEKRRRWADTARRAAMRERLAMAGIEWRALPYHSRPRVPATAWDVIRGAAVVARAVRDTGAGVVHCRGEVAMLMARMAVLPHDTRLLLDMRGFFADERVESGSWSRGGVLDRVVRRLEAANLRAADAMVVLTEKALEILRAGHDELPVASIIPTCVDTAVFRPAADTEARPFSAVYVGSLGTWYMVDEMVALAREIAKVVPGRPLFLTPDGPLAERAGVTPDWADVHGCDPADVPGWLRRARASFFVIRATPGKRGSCPTKLAEALASGLPVVANRGIGDVDEFLERDGIGVLIDTLDHAGYQRAADRLAELLKDPMTSRRCRRVAEDRFSLTSGIAKYRDLHARLAGRR